MDNNLAVQDTSQGMPTAQVPVNARVTAAAKQVRAAIKDVVIPDMVKILQNDKTPVETRTKVHKMFDFIYCCASIIYGCFSDHLFL